MPVITPTYPAFNSTFNITQSTKKILVKEFARGCEVSREEEGRGSGEQGRE
jgi:poly(A) polymerase